MSLFIEELRHVSEHTHRDPGVIVILGGGGIGKTKLLRAMKARAAEMGFRVVSGVGGLVEQSTPFFTVKTLITRLLELDTCKNIHDREQLILDHIQDENTRQLLPLLNDILLLKVAYELCTISCCFYPCPSVSTNSDHPTHAPRREDQGSTRTSLQHHS